MALVVQGLTRDFGGLRALDSISFTLEPGQILGLIGPNGAGKSTCFNVMAGSLRPSAGSVNLDGCDITGWPSHRIARIGVARVFQHTSVFAQLTVLQNILVGRHRRRRSRLWQVLLAAPVTRAEEVEARQEALAALAEVGLLERAEVYAGELSYGEQRRLSVAAALASRPRYLLLDEPAAGLNPRESQELATMLGRLRQDNLGILLVEHDMRMVMQTCDHLVVLATGRLLAEGTPEAIRSNPDVIAAYLGRQR